MVRAEEQPRGEREDQFLPLMVKRAVCADHPAAIPIARGDNAYSATAHVDNANAHLRAVRWRLLKKGDWPYIILCPYVNRTAIRCGSCALFQQSPLGTRLNSATSCAVN